MYIVYKEKKKEIYLTRKDISNNLVFLNREKKWVTLGDTTMRIMLTIMLTIIDVLVFLNRDTRRHDNEDFVDNHVDNYVDNLILTTLYF